MSFIYSALTHLLHTPPARVFSSHMEACILKERIFSGCEYENDGAIFSVVYLHYVFHHCDQRFYALWAEF